MWKLSFLLLLLPFIPNAYGQYTEYSIHINSALFAFSGNSNASSSFVDDYPSPPGNYISNPYGNNFTPSYGIDAQIQRVNRVKMVIGFQFGYELLRSHVKIDAVISDYDNSISPAIGGATLKMGFFNLYPYIGHRLTTHSLKIDLSIGPYLGFNVSNKEKSTIKLKTATGSCCTLSLDHKIRNPGTDFGLRPTMTIYYGHWGISTSFSYGFHNHRKSSERAYGKHFSRFITLGLVHKATL